MFSKQPYPSLASSLQASVDPPLVRLDSDPWCLRLKTVWSKSVVVPSLIRDLSQSQYRLIDPLPGRNNPRSGTEWIYLNRTLGPSSGPGHTPFRFSSISMHMHIGLAPFLRRLRHARGVEQIQIPLASEKWPPSCVALPDRLARPNQVFGTSAAQFIQSYGAHETDLEDRRGYTRHRG